MRVTPHLSIRLCEAHLKMYKIKPIKTNSKPANEIALEHFDFFYKPIFKNRWHSIRLGLLSEQKMCALMNNFTDCSESTRRLKDLGAFDLKNLLIQQNKTIEADPSSNHESETDGCKPWVMDKVIQRQIRPKVRKCESNFDGSSSPLINKSSFEEDFESRSSPESLHSFVPSSNRVVRTHDDVEISEISQVNQTFSGPPNIDIVSDDDIIYPDMLKVMLFDRGDVSTFPLSPKSAENVPTYYLLDASTVFSIVALNLKYGDHALDMCMSPGGTSLTMLQTLLLEKLVSNDVTSKLRGKRTLTDFVPKSADQIRSLVTLQYSDPSDPQSADEWRQDHFDRYDKVVVNVPCTYDRESLLDEETSDGPNPFGENMNAEKLRLPGRQAQVLKTGLQCLKPGGSLVYTTRTLSPIQNDSVVDDTLSLLEKEQKQPVIGRFVIRDLSPLAEKFCRAGVFRFFPFCRYGETVLPNLCANFGPMYICKFSRIY